MKKIKYIIALLFVSASLLSCEKSLMNFDNENADVYFQDGGSLYSSLASDSLYVSFSFTKSLDSVRNIIVAVTGGRVDRNRPYKLKLNDSSTAISGIHFEPLPESFMIKKNMLTDTIKLKLKRTPEMQTKTFEILFDLLPTDDFGTDLKSRIVSGKNIKMIRKKIRFDDIIRKPRNWLDGYFGVFSRAKLFYICEYFETTPQYLDTEIIPAEVASLGRILQRVLNDLKAAGTPVLEENGTEMRMGNSAQ